MGLPILQGSAAASRESLIRLFHRASLDWSRHLGEETALSVGTAISNAELSTVRQANRIYDAALVEGMTTEAAIAEGENHYAQLGSRCGGWVMNPSADPALTEPLVEALRQRQYKPIRTEIQLLGKLMPSAAPEIAELTIIPARASFRHYRALAEEDAADWNAPRLADASMLHLDDPRYDALLAIQSGRAVATIGVLAMGEAGVIEDLFVSRSERGRGIGRLLLDRALEICARSSFKHVMLDVDPENEPALRLYRAAGFHRLGDFTRYFAPSEPPQRGRAPGYIDQA